ncbi:MAG TPA: chloride channel protein [Epsilonproteobacteria bacterium]|nr:chloride channel protein [Campylobacterota bacterium]
MIAKLLIASILTGLLSGFFIAFYSLLITFLTYFFFMGDPIKTIPTLPVWYIYALPTIAIFIVNYIVSRDSNVKEYGLNEVADSIMANKMKLSLKTLFYKIFASALSLSTGFTVGTEGPSASIGAMIAYHVHKWFKLPSMLVKMMISIGASSGIAAIFVSPITGIAFAIEIIAYQFIKQYIGYLILASFVAFSIGIYFLEPIVFLHSQGRVFDFTHLFTHVLFIPFITVFIYLYLFLKKRVLSFIDLEVFRSMSRYRNHIFALIGGGVIGTILLLQPQAAFSGHVLILSLINSDTAIPLSIIFTIVFLRIIGTTVAIYANAVGGIFLPLMSIGALVGYGYAELLVNYTSIHAEPFYFAAVGAAVFMGVIMKLPLTAVILALETTFDYNVVIATGVSVVLVEYFSQLYFTIQRRNVTKVDRVQKVVEKEEPTEASEEPTEISK